jgi:integrase
MEPNSLIPFADQQALAAAASRGDRRVLTRAHFAFYRSVLQGVTPREAADRYLPETAHADSAVRAIRDELMAASRRSGRNVDRRLWTLGSVAKEHTAKPSLEVYRKRVDPKGGFYREEEVQEMYRQEYAETPPEARRRRFQARQLDALTELEQFPGTLPSPADPLDAWLDETLATRLAAGIRAEIRATLEAAKRPAGEIRQTVGAPVTLRQLVQRVERGRGWWIGIAGFGRGKALRVSAWVIAHAAELGASVEPHTLMPMRALPAHLRSDAARTYEFGLVPVERLHLPDALAGGGANRCSTPSPTLAAKTDLEAIQAWLKGRPSVATRESYRCHAERLLLWAALVKGRPLSGLTHEDCVDFQTFMAQPEAAWCGPPRPRYHAQWRPFQGPLSRRSRHLSRLILESFFEWLVEQRYLVANPWKSAPTENTRTTLDVGRAFTPRQWQLLLASAAQFDAHRGAPGEARHARLAFVLTFAQCTGLRLAELVGARLGHFRNEVLEEVEDTAWFLRVVAAKGRQVAETELSQADEVFVPPEAMAVLETYLEARGLDRDPVASPAAPLIADTWSYGRPDRQRPISRSALYKELKAFFAFAATAREEDVAAGRTARADAGHFAKASTHWLRHTFGREAVRREVPLDVLGANMRHASLATTSLYARAGKQRLASELTKAFGHPPRPK